MLERRTRDREEEQRDNFVIQGQFSVLTLMLVSSSNVALGVQKQGTGNPGPPPRLSHTSEL